MSKIGDFFTRFGAKFLGTPDLAGGFSVLLRGQEEAIVTGCRRILKYGEREMVLLIERGRLLVCGEGLFCFSFEGDALTLRGRISSVSVEGEE